MRLASKPTKFWPSSSSVCKSSPVTFSSIFHQPCYPAKKTRPLDAPHELCVADVDRADRHKAYKSRKRVHQLSLGEATTAPNSSIGCKTERSGPSPHRVLCSCGGHSAITQMRKGTGEVSVNRRFDDVTAGRVRQRCVRSKPGLSESRGIG